MTWGFLKIVFAIVIIPYSVVLCFRARKQLKELLRGITNTDDTELLIRVNKEFSKYNREKYESLEEFVADFRHAKRRIAIAQTLIVVLFIDSILFIYEGIKAWGGFSDLSFTFIVVSFILIPVACLVLMSVRVSRGILKAVDGRMNLERRVVTIVRNDPLWYKVFIYALMIFIVSLEVYLFLDILDIT